MSEESSSDYAPSITISELGGLGEILIGLSSTKKFALDIGGSLAKIAYHSKRISRKTYVFEGSSSRPYITEDKEKEEDCLHFVKFETRYLSECLDFISEHILLDSPDRTKSQVVRVTGGGAHMYRQLIEDKLKRKVQKMDEIDCLVVGCCFMLRHMPAGELFTYDHNPEPHFNFVSATDEKMFPFLLVNIGSGVSILQINNENDYKRVGGSSIGGGTFWGLGSLIADSSDFDELLRIASEGDHRSVDMLVGDIYGFDENSFLGLPADVIASSFGKAGRHDCTASKADLLRSLLITLSNNIAQLSYMHANKYQINRIVFAGYFIRGHSITMRSLTYGVQFWSQGRINAYFLRHEGYLGAIGAFIQGLEVEDSDSRDLLEFAWRENLCTSSKYIYSATSVVEFQKSHSLLSFPYLLESYRPDTWYLSEEPAAREYWIECFRKSASRQANQAMKSLQSHCDLADAENRASQFKKLYIDFLNEAQQNAKLVGELTVRKILEAQEFCLREAGFSDPYSEQKRLENEAALSQLSVRLKYLDGLAEGEKILALCTGLLAGNVFDWGAGHVAEMLKDGLDFEVAVKQLQPRPWLTDGLDAWTERLMNGPKFNCVLFFIDNSGCDLLLGVLPFCVDLLARGSTVVLVANYGPALNDVTVFELRFLIKVVAGLVPDLADALSQDRLLVVSSGLYSPCLDLRSLSSELVDVCLSRNVDLIIIEGMGRAVHTNLYAKFTIDCLKVAVLKNAWIAERLGGNMFSVIFSYESHDSNTS